MCRNLIFVSFDAKGKRLPEFVFDSLIKSISSNHDGYALYAILTDFQTIYLRTLSTYEYLRTLVSLMEKELLFLHTHQRAASVGSINVENVHLWKNGGVYFSHNGHVWKYAAHALLKNGRRVWFRVEGSSDSKVFFENNAEKIALALQRSDPQAFYNLCDSEELEGIAMANDEKGKFICVGVERPVHLYLTENYAVVSNVPVTFKETLCEWVMGWPPSPTRQARILFKKQRIRRKYPLLLLRHYDYNYDPDFFSCDI